MLTTRFATMLVIVLAVSFSVLGQSQSIEELMQASIARASETASFGPDGKLRSAQLKIPFDQERLFTFGSNSDDSSLTVTDDANRTVELQISAGNRITGIKFPNGETATISWNENEIEDIIIKQSPNDPGKWVNLMEFGGCADAIERAQAAIFIAAGVCTAAPGSVGCWSAVATAGYLTYRTYVECGAINE